jgi:hypothetical protein
LAEQNVVDKFLNNAAPVLGERRARDLLAAVDGVEDLGSARVLAALLRAESEDPATDQRGGT